MKRKFVLILISILAITTLLFAGCSNNGKNANNSNGINNIQQASTFSNDVGASLLKKNAKNITDADLLNSANADSSTQLDSLDNQSLQLSSDEIDVLLNDNSTLNNIPSKFNVK